MKTKQEIPTYLVSWRVDLNEGTTRLDQNFSGDESLYNMVRKAIKTWFPEVVDPYRLQSFHEFRIVDSMGSASYFEVLYPSVEDGKLVYSLKQLPFPRFTW